MVRRCPNCPGKVNRIEYLYQIISDNTEDEIDFQQWDLLIEQLSSLW